MEPGVEKQANYFIRDYKHGKALAIRYLKLINSAKYRQENPACKPNVKVQKETYREV